MGFRYVRELLIDALVSAQYEAREVISEKNLLAVEAITAERVVLLLQRCRGDQYISAPHHSDSTVVCHVFRPTVGTERWYIKAYFLSYDAVFISVHLSEG